MFNEVVGRRLLATALGSIVLLAQVGCGGGGGGADTGTTAVSAGGTNVTISSTDAATFMIGMTVQDQQGVQTVSLHGTGFAIGDNLIATNAHVTKGVLDNARDLAQQGRRIVAVTAYQSETGKVFPLLTAIVHPSYNSDIRSPDVGLFVTRDALPSKLTLDDAQATTRLRKGDPMQLNGFPGDLFNAVYENYQPGLTVPKATLFSCNIQTIENFNTSVVVDPNNLAVIEMYQHGCDTSGGTSGSPMLNGGKVFGLHNAGITYRFRVPAQGAQSQLLRIPTATGSWGVHVKHLINLKNFYDQGVLEADKQFTLPPSDALVRAPARQSTELAGAGNVFRGAVSNASLPGARHDIQFTVAQNLSAAGTASWPANPSARLPARTHQLIGVAQPNGRIELRDNTPETIPGFRRGIYTGVLNTANGVFTGQYFELNEAANELFYFGDWTAGR